MFAVVYAMFDCEKSIVVDAPALNAASLEATPLIIKSFRILTDPLTFNFSDGDEMPIPTSPFL